MGDAPLQRESNFPKDGTFSPAIAAFV